MGKPRARVALLVPGPWAEIIDPGPPAQQLRLDTPAWFAWLDAPTTQSFSYPVFDPTIGAIVGFLTVRKERRLRGGSYWAAFRRIGGQLRKGYLGRSADVTSQRLEAMAAHLGAE